MLRQVHLHGRLATKFPQTLRYDTQDTVETVRALCSTLPGFKEEFRRGSYQIIAGNPHEAHTREIGMDEVRMGLGPKDLHIIPVPHGAKSGSGIGKVVIGIALLAITVVSMGTAAPATIGGFLATEAISFGSGLAITWGNIAFMGLAMAAGGLSQLLSAQPQDASASAANRESPANAPSFSFNGAVNMVEQGHPIPLVYGRMRVGSIVVSGGISTEDIDPGPGPTNQNSTPTQYSPNGQAKN